MTLNTQPNFHQQGRRFLRDFSPGDDFYEALIAMHQDLSEEESAQVNARLILLLSNHIGDLDVLREAMNMARQGIGAPVGGQLPAASPSLPAAALEDRYKTEPALAAKV
ncbi:DUF2783 domain-containing protein [Telmatospirillum sp. J64-1]|uniref:DUF2783 domain-containing protein n=1 Tax=Telmatospirillum sp. J64-1 TaxID=2502183 RepID=UPI00115F0E5C